MAEHPGQIVNDVTKNELGEDIEEIEEELNKRELKKHNRMVLYRDCLMQTEKSTVSKLLIKKFDCIGNNKDLQILKNLFGEQYKEEYSNLVDEDLQI